jgi:hypothetical protein
MSTDEYRRRLTGRPIAELIDLFNREVGINAWVRARGEYLVALREALLATGLDCSTFIDDRTIAMSRRIRQEGQGLVPIEDTPP